MSLKLKYIGPGDYENKHKFDGPTGEVEAFLSQGLKGSFSLAPGTVFDAVLEQKTSKNGRQYMVLSSVNGDTGKGGAPKRGGGYRSGGASREEMVTSIVAAAVRAGKVDTPAQLKAWATASYGVLNSLGPASAAAAVARGSQSEPPKAAPPSPPAGSPDEPPPFPDDALTF